MTRSAYRLSIGLLTFGCLAMLGLILARRRGFPEIPAEWFAASSWGSIKTVFFSLFLEALPFLLLGVFVSSLIHLFVPEQLLRRLLPAHPIPGVLLACLLGIILPVCECGMIPIVRGLIRKGMPVYLGITYVLAAPILNPVTYASTYLAFRGQPEMAAYRMGLAFAAAAVIGWILYAVVRRDPLRSVHDVHAAPHDHRHDHGHDGHDEHVHRHEGLAHTHGGRSAALRRTTDTLVHASDEFFDMGKYLMLGAFLTALVQTFVSRQDLLSLAGGTFGSHLLMMGFAYVISLCSTSDAFIAASFSGTFSPAALLGFLVFGPMIDFKNTLMLLAAFRTRFVILLSVLVASVVLALSLALETLIS